MYGVGKMLVTNIYVKTMEGTDFPHGFIRFEEEKIVEIGDMEHCPPGEAFDGQGAYALPGFIDAHCHLGMWEEGSGFEGDDGNEDSDPCTPHLRALDGIKIDCAFAEAARAGIAAVMTGPGSANPIAGQMCVIQTVGSCVDDMILKAPAAMKFAFGENPKNTYHEKQQGPVTRMGIAAIIREQLTKAQKYQEQMQRAQEDEDFDEPEFDAKCEALLPLLSGQIPAHIHAHTADDIFTGIRIAKEFGLRYVIVHGTGAGKIVDSLAQQKTCVITGPLIGARTKPELVSFEEDTPGRLSAAGVQTAICTDHPEIPARYLLLSAKLAVEAGMSVEAALEAITTVPARICGVEERMGSLKVGKDANIALFRENPMTSACSRPFAVWLFGKSVAFL